MQTFQLFRLLTPASSRLFQLTTRDELYTRYNAFSIQMQKRMASRWQATGSPPYDGPGEITAYLANRVVLEILNGMAERAAGV